MTRDEILNMPAGREMDYLIATCIMGWKLAMVQNGTYPSQYLVHQTLGRILPDDFDRYSTDLSTAFEVIQKMHEMKYKYTLHGHFMGSELQIATFDHQDWADANPLYKAVADSAPLAICRAALLAVMK